MILKIQFKRENDKVKECIPDKIRLTKSLNQETGTILLSFSKVFSLDIMLNETKPITAIYIKCDNFLFTTKDIRCIWQEGKPILIQAIFLIHKKEELNLILNIFKDYAQKNGLTDYKID